MMSTLHTIDIMKYFEPENVEKRFKEFMDRLDYVIDYSIKFKIRDMLYSDTCSIVITIDESKYLMAKIIDNKLDLGQIVSPMIPNDYELYLQLIYKNDEEVTNREVYRPDRFTRRN
jgi:hypothetical protein